MEQVLWRDASLEQASVDYDAVVLRIRESSGQVKSVRCEGYIAFALSGFWDETIIESAELLSQHPAIERAVSNIARRLGKGWTDSGNEQRNSRRWGSRDPPLGGCSIDVVAAKCSVAMGVSVLEATLRENDG
jgi:hypothetical protein